MKNIGHFLFALIFGTTIVLGQEKEPDKETQRLLKPVYGSDSLRQDPFKPHTAANETLLQQSSSSGKTNAHPSILSEFTAGISEELPPRRRVDDTVVECQKNHMIVTLKFSNPFTGYVYIFGFFPHCILFEGHHERETRLRLHHGACGTKIIQNEEHPEFTPVIEHRLMIQWEKEFVCDDDSSVIVRCDRPDDFNKTVAWNLGTLAQFGDIHTTVEREKHPGPKMWMEIQRGEGPRAPPLENDRPVHLGDVLTLVFTLSDNVFWFDSNVISCSAFDAGRETKQIEWEGDTTNLGSSSRHYAGQMEVIENECSVKPKLFSHFFKEKFTATGNLVTLHYAHFKAFRFPTSVKVLLQCEVQVCYRECPKLSPCSTGFHPRVAAQERRRRAASESTDGTIDTDLPHEMDRVALFRTIEVFTSEDAALRQVPVTALTFTKDDPILSQPCYTSNTFFAWVGSLLFIIFILIMVFLFVLYRSNVSKAVYSTDK